MFTGPAAHWRAGLDLTTSFLVGAVLAPTDPVFASAIVGRREVPAELRQLLNVESGVNDGPALPVALMSTAACGPAPGTVHAAPGTIAVELLLGLVVGIDLPLTVNGLAPFRLPGAEPKLQPLLPPATGTILYAACHLTHANPYLAAFSAGAVFAHVSPEATASFEPLGEALAEFAAVLAPIVLVRPASLLLSLLGTRISRREKLVAAWFGPKGFASVVYGLLVLQSEIPQAREAFTLVAVCIAFSIIAHGSTDVPIARAFDVEDLAGIPAADDDAGTARLAATPTAEGTGGL
ncbi:cation:proton antiporter [Streptomyces anandii]|uniref:cation:proton antiporter domain-containing protein n=1 Tax=Streptomyces anandii TaxID=285454 RepID=UPI0036FC6431